MHDGLVHQLGDLPRAAIPDVKHLPHGREHRARAVNRLNCAARHDRQRPGLGPVDPARYRRVDMPAAHRGQPRVIIARKGGGERAHVDQNAVLGAGLRDPAGAKVNLFHRRGR